MKFFIKSQVKLFSRIVTAWTAISVCLIVTILFAAGVYTAYEPITRDAIANSVHVYGEDYSEHKLLALSVSGIIDGTPPADSADRVSGVVYGYELKTQLAAAAKDDQVAGVILEIDSPGGTIYGAQAIADGIADYRQKTKKPVYAHVSGLAASGGYWAAASADKILADVGSSIGSIGVLEGPFFYYDKVLSQEDGSGSVATQNGIQSVTISAGKGKTLGDPYTKLNPEQIAALQTAVNDDYSVFVNYISGRRGIPAEVIRGSIGALIYGTQGATANKLIDGAMGREEVYAAVAKAADLQEGDYEVVRPGDVAVAGPGMAQQALSLIGRRSATSSKKRVAAESSFCSVQGAKAYYGDISLLCAK